MHTGLLAGSCSCMCEMTRMNNCTEHVVLLEEMYQIFSQVGSDPPDVVERKLARLRKRGNMDLKG